MAKHKDKEILEEQEQEIEEQLEEELEEMQDSEEVEEVSEEDEACMDRLVKLQADFENFKARTQREKSDMIFFLKQDILLKVLPRLDDLQRMLQNTPENERKGALYEGLVTLEKKLVSDLEKMWVKSFKSCGWEVNPDKHEVMTTVPGKKEWIICDEFEKWYELDWRVLRHAKVVVWAG